MKRFAGNITPLAIMVMRHMVGVLALLLLASNGHAALTASIDRSSVYDNESVQLTLRVDAQVGNVQLDVSALNSDFEIISNNRQQQYTVSNGRAKSSTEWNLVLIPRRTGNLVIPSLKLRGEVSNALELKVQPSASRSSTSANVRPIFAEAVVDKDTVYVQQQILLTLRLYTSVSLTDYNLTPLTVDGAIVRQVAENQYQKRVDGRDYLVIEVRFAVFPQTSGELTIPAQRFGAFEAPRQRQFGGFSQRGNQVLRNTDSKRIEALQRPAQIAGDQWMPSAQVELTETWSSDLGELRVGEPVTRSITITAEGLTGAQIHPLNFAAADDHRVYPDKAQLETRNTDDGALGVRIESMALVPNREGQIQLPALEVAWWNTRTGQPERTVLAGRVLQIAAAAAERQASLPTSAVPGAETPLAASAAPENAAQPSRLLTFSLSANALLLSAIAGLLLLRIRSAVQPPTKNLDRPDQNRASLKQQLKTIRREAAENNLLGMRKSILQWGQTLLPDTPPKTLQALAKQLQDSILHTEFAALDAHLYNQKSSETIDLDRLFDQLGRQTVQPTTTQRSGERPLQPLYPTGGSR